MLIVIFEETRDFNFFENGYSTKRRAFHMHFTSCLCLCLLIVLYLRNYFFSSHLRCLLYSTKCFSLLFWKMFGEWFTVKRIQPNAMKRNLRIMGHLFEILENLSIELQQQFTNEAAQVLSYMKKIFLNFHLKISNQLFKDINVVVSC